MSKRRNKHGRGGEGRHEQSGRPGWAQTVGLFCAAGGCLGAAWASKMLYEAPAADFLRAINQVPWTAWDGRVALGLGLLVIIGAQALSMLVLGGVFLSRLTAGASGAS